MRCPHCNQEHADNIRFCPLTGKAIEAPAPPAWSTQETYVQPPQVRKPIPWLLIGLAAAGVILLAVGALVLLSENLPSLRRQPQSELSAAVTPAADEQAGAAQAGEADDQNPSAAQEAPETAPSSTLLPTLTPLPSATSLPSATLAPTQTPTTAPSPTPTLPDLETATNEADGASMVWVPPGEFSMGSDPNIDPYFWGAEAPSHKVTLQGYWIYQLEVTNAMYAACAEAKACPIPEQVKSRTRKTYYNSPQYADYPVVFVDWTSAQSYCRWVGGGLPTEAQWEKAARGEDGRLFPWSSSPPTGSQANLCDQNCPTSPNDPGIDDGYRDTAPVGSFPAGASPYGLLDAAGNVWEWVFDYFQETYYKVSPLEDPPGPASGKYRVVRGGSFDNSTPGMRAVVRYAVRPDLALDTVGFRCVVTER